jgi:hypothetical protein
VLPLASVNAQVFVSEMIKTIDQPCTSLRPGTEAHHWNNFLKTLAQKGYILPGARNNLDGEEPSCEWHAKMKGVEHTSWIITYPEGGLKNSHVFDNLQLCGNGGWNAINDIPSIKVGPSQESSEEM